MMFSRQRSANYLNKISPTNESSIILINRLHNELPQNNFLPLTSTIKYGLLTKVGHDSWRINIEPGIEGGRMRLPKGEYYFVKMLNGEIRITLTPVDIAQTMHLDISENADSILYAGKIYFDFNADSNPTIVSWTNDAPAYSPSPDLFEQAGLPASRFSPTTNPSIFEPIFRSSGPV